MRATYDMLDLKTKCCTRPKAEDNILSEGPTYHMLSESPVNNCFVIPSFGLGLRIVSKLNINSLTMIKLVSIWDELIWDELALV